MVNKNFLFSLALFCRFDDFRHPLCHTLSFFLGSGLHHDTNQSFCAGWPHKNPSIALQGLFTVTDCGLHLRRPDQGVFVRVSYRPSGSRRLPVR